MELILPEFLNTNKQFHHVKPLLVVPPRVCVCVEFISKTVHDFISASQEKLFLPQRDFVALIVWE